MESVEYDRKRAAIRTILHQVVIKPLPAGVACNPRQQHQGQGCAPRTRNGDLAATRRI